MKLNRLLNGLSFFAIGVMIIIQQDLDGALIDGFKGLAATCLFAFALAIYNVVKGINELDEEYDDVEIVNPTIHYRINEYHYNHEKNWK